MKFQHTRLGVAVLLAAAAAAAADGGLPNYVAPDTKIVIGIRVRSLVDLLSRSFGSDFRTAASGLLSQVPLAGFDPLHDLDEVILTSNGKGENPPMLMVAIGRFDVERLAKNAKPYHGVPILETGGGTRQVIAVLDGATAIAGDAPQVREAIDRRGSESGLDADLAARVEPLRSRYDVWGIGDRPQGAVVPRGAPDTFQSLDRFEFGTSLGHGLELTARLHFTSVEEAEKMSSSLRLLEAMMKAQPQSGGTRFGLRSENGTLQLSLAIPEEELKKAIAAQRATLASAVAAQVGRKTMPAATPSEPKTLTDEKGNTVMVTLPGKR